MKDKPWTNWLGALLAGTAAIGAIGAFPDAASAQRANDDPPPTIPQEFDRVLYRNDKTFFGDNNFPRIITWYLGIPRFPENEIEQDARNINRLYREVLEQQVSSDPTIRTPDLPNPYSSSLLTTPLVIVEEPIPPAPPAPVIRQPAAVEAPPPVVTETEREAPVPGLW